MNSRPFFSVVIPVYNRAELFSDTLTSVLGQRFKDFEIVVVNDGSTDNTASVLQTLASKDPRVKILYQQNKERGAARNNGLSNSNGKYVVFFDSDDIMHENHLEVLHKNILELNYPFFIATKFDFVNESGKHRSSDLKFVRQGYYDYTFFLNGNSLACNICIKKDNPGLVLFEEDRRYAIKEDWLFLLVNTQKEKLYIIDEITLSMTDHPDRSMRSDNNEIIRKTILAYEWILKRLSLTKTEQNILLTHVNYFCGIHSYLENKKGESINYSLKAIETGGIKLKYVSLLLKSIVGRKVISSLK